MTHRISGNKSLGEHDQLDLLGGGLLDEPNHFLDGGRLVHKDGSGMSRCHLELGELGRRHGCVPRGKYNPASPVERRRFQMKGNKKLSRVYLR